MKVAVEERPVPRFTRAGVEYLDFGFGLHGTVVFAHGFRDSAQGWVPLGRELVRRRWRVLAVQRKAAPPALPISESSSRYMQTKYSASSTRPHRRASVLWSRGSPWGVRSPNSRRCASVHGHSALS